MNLALPETDFATSPRTFGTGASNECVFLQVQCSMNDVLMWVEPTEIPEGSTHLLWTEF